MEKKLHVGRRDFVKLIGVASLATAAGNAVVRAADTAKGQEQATAAKPLIDGTPAVFAPATDSVTVIWTVNGPARGWVEFGTDPKNLDKRTSGDGFGYTPHHERVLKVRLKGLSAGTRYWWRAACVSLAPAASNASSLNPPAEPPPVYTSVYSFATLSPSAPETNFIVWNDTHSRKETLEQLSKMAASSTDGQNPDFLLWNGDITQRNHNDASLIPDVYVHPSGTVDLAKLPPIFLTRGNHDVRGLWANKVMDFVDFPDTHANGRICPYYAFRSGPLGAIVLDTGEDKPDRHSSFRGLVAFEPLIAEQAQWLEKIIEHPELKNAPVKAVFCHIPLRWIDERPQNYFGKPAGFDRFSKRGRDAWHASLVRWGVRVIISGHVHRWVHIPANSEFPYAQITGGGPELERARLLRGHVTASGIKLTAYNMAGHEVETVRF